MDSFRDELRDLLKKYRKEGPTETRADILADYLVSCLMAYSQAVRDNSVILNCTKALQPKFDSSEQGRPF